MAKDDLVKVTYRTPVGTETVNVEARSNGSSVQVVDPTSASDPYLRVRELNKVQEPVRTFRFAKSEVLAVIEGRVDRTAKK